MEDVSAHCHSSATAEVVSQANAPIGVFDSGLGGLSVLNAIHCDLPFEDLLYVADSRHAPYGDKTDAFILDRSLTIGQWLIDQGAKALVVACNTATASAVQALRARFSVPIVGIEPGLKPATLETVNGHVAVLATPSTLASERYTRLLARIQAFAPQVRFVSAPGLGWVERVEAGDFSSAATVEAVRQVIEPLMRDGADTLVLGCTHYPFLRYAISKVAPGIRIVDTAPAIAREIARRVRAESAPNTSPCLGQLKIITTGLVEPALAFVQRVFVESLPVAHVDL